MFDMNPLQTPNALFQHWVMLLIAGTLGFIISYISRKGMLAQFEGDLASTNRELADCQQAPAPVATGIDEQALLSRIRARAGELNLDRIGYATADAADDLEEIVGIGPFLEKKLNAIGIYSFRQIANFTPEDMTKVNEIIEFFPGRIERDDWVGQSAELLRRK